MIYDADKARVHMLNNTGASATTEQLAHMWAVLRGPMGVQALLGSLKNWEGGRGA